MYARNRTHVNSLIVLLILPLLTIGCAIVSREESTPVEPTENVIEISPTPEPDLRAIQVETVGIQIGVGSPIPVEVDVSGSWPDLCAQLAQIRQIVDGHRIEVSLLATPLETDCPPDFVGVPFAMAIPLNMVEMPEGVYTVSVNGVETTFDWNLGAWSPVIEEPLTDAPLTDALTLAYLGSDGNVWGLRWPDGDIFQLTSDAQPASGDEPAVSYAFPRISSDGMFVAFRRDQGTPTASGFNFQFGLWVYDVGSGQSQLAYDQIPAGFDWKPGTHTLAFGKGVTENYFSRDGSPNKDLANGIWAFNVDTGEVSELVKPERGFALYTPVWSPDGRFLAFDELFGYEGRGRFAMFNFESNDYLAWDEQIGNYAWSPDSRKLAYDRLTYTAIGVERIFLRDLQNENEQLLSPDFEAGYAFLPSFSPSGEQVAYLAGLGGPESQSFTLYVQDTAGGEPKSLGTFESVLNLHWSSDYNQLIFSAGPYDRQTIYAVDVGTGDSQMLAEGTQPHSPGAS